MSTRKGLPPYSLWIALALTLGVTLWTSMSENEGAVDVAAPRASLAKAGQPAQTAKLFASGSTATTPADDFDMDHLQRPAAEDAVSNLFNIDTPEAQLAAQASQQEAPKAPEVPDLPFTYAGKLQDDGKLIVFLSKGNLNYTVREGDVIGKWQVARIAPPQMIMRYRPMNAEVPLMIGDIN
ncbi:hypothetical protein [Methylovorus glucosotrophus]|uniref:Prolin-rich transmembrane protein n=1 Tax=Methylovorus glucosotrophus (strain SIP3-4) TaxID=582744 RepID=C6XC14_METGS|nr:hypothetical protein [Methylovorus glucosotrophus]ACT50089.1 conserved hypothetical protein [Methylovorus glucosotrophus SIP3-4]